MGTLKIRTTTNSIILLNSYFIVVFLTESIVSLSKELYIIAPKKMIGLYKIKRSRTRVNGKVFKFFPKEFLGQEMLETESSKKIQSDCKNHKCYLINDDGTVKT